MIPDLLYHTLYVIGGILSGGLAISLVILLILVNEMQEDRYEQPPPEVAKGLHHRGDQAVTRDIETECMIRASIDHYREGRDAKAEEIMCDVVQRQPSLVTTQAAAESQLNRN